MRRRATGSPSTIVISAVLGERLQDFAALSAGAGGWPLTVAARLAGAGGVGAACECAVDDSRAVAAGGGHLVGGGDEAADCRPVGGGEVLPGLNVAAILAARGCACLRRPPCRWQQKERLLTVAALLDADWV